MIMTANFRTMIGIMNGCDHCAYGDLGLANSFARVSFISPDRSTDMKGGTI
jgi:hypothetical protein